MSIPRLPLLGGPPAVLGLSLALGSCGGSRPAVAPEPLACLVVPAAGAVPLDSVRVVVADSALAGRFVRRADSIAAGPADCAGEARRLDRRPDRGPDVRVTVLSAPADPRDFLDRDEADLLVSRDARLLDYARRLGRFRVLPLPWDLTYVLAGGGLEPPSEADRAALARDAVRGDARGAEPPFWWRDPAACSTAETGGRADLVVSYPEHDPIGRALAERIVALMTLPEPPEWLASLGPAGKRSRSRTEPTRGGDPPTGLRVLAYPRTPPAICDSSRWRRDAAPLIDSRAFVVVKPAVPAFEIRGDGSIAFLSPAGR